MRRPICLALALALLAWSGALVRGGFALDDRELIVGNAVVEGALPWSAAFLRDYLHHHGDAGQWRPIATLSLAADHALHGLEPLGYHVTNLLLHLAVVTLAGWLLGRIPGAAEAGARRAGSAAALALFAVHPAFADVVAWISGRTSSLSALAGLGAVAAVLRLRGTLPIALGACAGLFLALGSKEDGLLFAPVILVTALSRSRRAALAAAAAILLALVAAGWLRDLSVGSALPRATHAPLAEASLLERSEVGGGAMARALRLAAAPLPHAPSVAPEELREPAALVALAAWLVLATSVLGGGWLLLRARAARARVIGASLALAALAYLPHTQLVPSGELFAPRFLYLPLLLALPANGALIARLAPSRALLATILGLCIAGAWVQSGAYASRTSYWRAVLDSYPADARAWNDLGNARREEGDRTGARAAYERARTLRPAYSRPWIGLGTLALEDGELERAEQLLLESVRRGPQNPKAHGNLGVLYLRLDEPERAAQAYRAGLDLAPGLFALWRGLARAEARLGNEGAAREALERALELSPQDPAARRLEAELGR